MAQDKQFDLLILGGGHAAGELIRSLSQKKFAGDIGLVTDEEQRPYQRPPLSKGFLTGAITEERLPLVPEKTWERLNCEVLTGQRAEILDRPNKSVKLRSGIEIVYESLVICTGASPRRLRIPGIELSGVRYLRSLKDAVALRQAIGSAQRVLVVGGGYIGLEVAAGARKLGKAVTVLERENRILPRVVAPEVSAYFASLHNSQGVQILTQESVAQFLGSGQPTSIETSSGEKVSADVALIGIGIQPDIALAQDAGLDTNDGILVDESCRTNDPSIFAAGDCTRFFSRLYNRPIRLESVQNATDQARIIAAALTGDEKSYDPVPWFWSEQFDVKIQIAGLNDGYDRLVARGDPAGRKVSFLYFLNDRLIACDAINAVADFMAAKKLIAAKIQLDPTLAADASKPLKQLVPPA